MYVFLLLGTSFNTHLSQSCKLGGMMDWLKLLDINIKGKSVESKDLIIKNSSFVFLVKLFLQMSLIHFDV